MLVAPKLAAGSLALAAFALVFEARADIPYNVAVSNGSYTEITGGSTYVPVSYDPGFSNWDEGDAAIPLPFTFLWFGRPYNTIYAYTNGFVSFSAPLSMMVLGPPSVVPNASNPIHAFIGVTWSDLEGGAMPEFRAQTIGTAPNRVFVVQEKGLVRFGDPASNVSFQVLLHETTNEVEVVFGPNNGIINGTTAVENSDGTQGANLLDVSPTCTQASCACSLGTCGSSNWPSGRTVTITLPQGPDLTGTISGPRGAFPGTMFNAVLHLENLGLTAAGASHYDVRLSPSSTSTVGSRLLVSNPLAAIPASTTLTTTVALMMPANQPAGTYYLALVVDPMNQVMETIENDNVAFDTAGIATAPDLAGTLTAPPSSGPGEQLSVMLTINNDGAPVMSAVHVAFFLSNDRMLDASDLPMGTASISLPDGFSQTTNVPLTVPANAPPSPPDYFVLAHLDDQNQIAELDESNNVVVSGPVTLHAPDLTATAFGGGSFGFLGFGYPLTATLQNQGGATANNFTACVVLSRNQHISLLGDRVLFTSLPMTLHPGETAAVNLAPTIPVSTATGAWYIAVIVDCGETVIEGSEVNNVAERMDPITIRTPAPDFTPVEVDTASIAAAGDAIPISVRIENIGNAAGAVPLRIVVSQSPGVSALDLAIYDSPTPIMLAPDEVRTISVWANLPIDLPSGTYYVGAILDPSNQIDEVLKTNNNAASRALIVSGADLAIVTPPPPPAVIGVPYVRRFSAAGGTGPYTFSLTWAQNHGPSSITFDPASVELKGTPTAADAGRYPFTVHVTSGSLTADRDYALVITPATIPLSIVSSRLPPALAMEMYSVQLVAVGGVSPYTWSLVGGAPVGIALAESGQLGGQPQIVGAYVFTVAVMDGSGASVEGMLALDVVDPTNSLTITTADIPTALLGMPYDTTFTAAGGVAPYTWRIEPTKPLIGLRFDAMSAELTGTPTIAGEYPFIVQVQDRNGLLDRNAFVLSVLAPGDLVIVTGQSSENSLPTAHVGVAYVNTDGSPPKLTASRRAGGDTGPLTWMIVDGGLPPGIALDKSSAALFGTPTTEGKFPFRVLVVSPGGDFAFAALIIQVQPANGSSTMPGAGGKSCGCTSVHDARSNGTMWASLLIAALALLRGRVRRLGSMTYAAYLVDGGISSASAAGLAPDFRVLAVQPLERDRAPGEILDVAYTAINAGTAPGRLEIEAVLSQNDLVSVTDLVLGSAPPIDLMPGQTVSGTISGAIAHSMTTGAYWVGVIADPNQQVDELSELDDTGRSLTPVFVVTGDLEITTDALPIGTIGQAYSGFMRAVGGDGTFVYRILNGALPHGTNFDPIHAEVLGVPLEAGNFPLGVEVMSRTLTATKTIALEIRDPLVPLAILTRDLPPAILGQDYAIAIRTIGGLPPYAWSIADGSLPSGISFGSDGTLFGSPTAPGFATFAIGIADRAASTASITYSLDVRSPGNLTIVPSNLAGATLGETYDAELSAIGGTPPLRWKAISDPPAGLVVSVDGRLGGVPEKIGAYRFRIEVSDASGISDTNLAAIAVSGTGSLQIIGADLPEVQVGQDLHAVIHGAGGQPPYTWEIAKGEGDLPPMLDASAEGDDFVLSGHLEKQGVWTFTIRLFDAEARVADRPFAIVASAPPVAGKNNQSRCSCVVAAHRNAEIFVFVSSLFVIRRSRSKGGRHVHPRT